MTRLLISGLEDMLKHRQEMSLSGHGYKMLGLYRRASLPRWVAILSGLIGLSTSVAY